MLNLLNTLLLNENEWSWKYKNYFILGKYYLELVAIKSWLLVTVVHFNFKAFSHIYIKINFALSFTFSGSVVSYYQATAVCILYNKWKYLVNGYKENEGLAIM